MFQVLQFVQVRTFACVSHMDVIKGKTGTTVFPLITSM
jgi:hypothetical protein